MIAPVRHILPLTTIRRERVLPIPGKVVVRKGQKVGAADSVAEAKLNPEHLLLDVARGLRLSEEKADLAILCKPGEKVAEGDVLAGPVGFPKRVIRATKNGRVILTGGGQILLEVENRPFELKAAVPVTNKFSKARSLMSADSVAGLAVHVCACLRRFWSSST